MATALEVIQSAYSKIGVKQAGQLLSSELQAEGLEYLQDLLAEFPQRGYTYTPTPLLTNSVLALPDAVIGSLKVVLADKMAGNSAQPRLGIDMVTAAWSMIAAVLKADNKAVLPNEFGFLNNFSKPYINRY